MNWGYKILVVYGIFVAGIVFMVFKSSNEKMDLVTTDYYAKELKYQDKIDATLRANSLSEDISYEVTGKQVVLHFPKDFAGKKITGTAELYCPSDEDKDIKQDFAVDDATVTININTGNKGQHELHISWQVNGVDYYFEKKIFI
jgi:hypothetical protein